MFTKFKEALNLNTRFGFYLFAVVLFWLKTYLTYLTAFDLGVEGAFQHFILFINPIASTMLLFGLSLFVKNPKRGYRALLLIYFLNSLLLFANIAYYREFTDFMTIKTMMASGNSTKNIGPGILAMLDLTDVVYWLDFILLVYVYRKKNVARFDSRPFKKRWAFLNLAMAALVFFVNLSLADTDRPQLLTRTFDRNYIVKYLGLNAYTVYDGVITAQANQVKASADSSDMATVLDYVEDHFASANDVYFGQAEGRNVVYIHLESMQQFLIDLSLPDVTGSQQEVTPFLNELYHSSDSYSFSNVFHQVSQGKTSDAELLLDNSLFGLAQGSAFTLNGPDNTFQSQPQIMRNQGYTTAVFHGNTGSFWNRDNTYKSFGYDYFFNADTSYTLTEENSLEYGLKDKLFFQESAQYIEQLQQPFYAKFITVSNHFPFPEDESTPGTFDAGTEDETINGYFNTVHYADQALEEFFQYMKDTGLYDNTIFVLYGDHYGISNTRNPALAPLLGENAEEWNEYDDMMLQRIPLIIHVPGSGTGGINDTYGGQVDVMPTVLHLLGVETENYVMLGQDLLSEEHEEVVAMRNGNVVADDYSLIGSNVYDTESGTLVTLTDDVQQRVAELQTKTQTQLAISDQIINGDLLRFYTPEGFEPADKSSFDYLDSPGKLLEEAEAAGDENTSLYYSNGEESTVPLYQTDAPELESTQAAEAENSDAE